MRARLISVGRSASRSDRTRALRSFPADPLSLIRRNSGGRRGPASSSGLHAVPHSAQVNSGTCQEGASTVVGVKLTFTRLGNVRAFRHRFCRPSRCTRTRRRVFEERCCDEFERFGHQFIIVIDFDEKLAMSCPCRYCFVGAVRSAVPVFDAAGGRVGQRQRSRRAGRGVSTWCRWGSRQERGQEWS